MSRLYKLTDTAQDSFLVLVGDTEDETDASSKWETWRDTPGNLPDPENREVQSVSMYASTLVSDQPFRPWVDFIE